MIDFIPIQIKLKKIFNLYPQKQQQQCTKLNALNESTTSRSRDISNNELNSNTQTTIANSKVMNSTPLINPRKGDFLLNRTHSTEGIASKLSLELKKRYLLGSAALSSSISKSGSTSNADTRLRKLSENIDTISQHQKLLNAPPESNPTVQALLQSTNHLRVSGGNQSLSPLSPSSILNKGETKVFAFESKSIDAGKFTLS